MPNYKESLRAREMRGVLENPAASPEAKVEAARLLDRIAVRKAARRNVKAKAQALRVDWGASPRGGDDDIFLAHAVVVGYAVPTSRTPSQRALNSAKAIVAITGGKIQEVPDDGDELIQKWNEFVRIFRARGFAEEYIGTPAV